MTFSAVLNPLLRDDVAMRMQGLSDAQRALVALHVHKATQAGVSEWGLRDMVVSLARYLTGETGFLDLSLMDPIPPTHWCDASALPPADAQAGDAAWSQLVCIKLNGGLGTSMGCRGPKSLVTIDHHRRFIDMVMAQLHDWRRATGAPLPMVLLNSYYTMHDTMAALSSPDVVSLMQHQVPRLCRDTSEPFLCPDDPAAEWNPPGHGDLFHSLHASGQLDRLLAQGFRYAFVSNIDNLAATVSPSLLGHMINARLDMLMEVTPKLPQDRKGGTVAMMDGRLALVERSQVSSDQWDQLDQQARYPWFNTNSIWINLASLANALQHAPMTLPLLVNPKTVHGQSVVQLETAMGAAIGVLPHTGLVSVGRDRFFPVKTTADLVLCRSNRVTKQANGTLSWHDLPTLILGEAYNQMDALSSLMPCIPDLSQADSLHIMGTVAFRTPWAVQGSVTIHNPTPHVVSFDGGVVANGTYTYRDTPTGGEWVKS